MNTKYSQENAIKRLSDVEEELKMGSSEKNCVITKKENNKK